MEVYKSSKRKKKKSHNSDISKPPFKYVPLPFLQAKQVIHGYHSTKLKFKPQQNKSKKTILCNIDKKEMREKKDLS